MQSGTADSERALVSRAQAGDFEAFEQLVSLYQAQVFSTAMLILQRSSADAEEVVQETFLSALEHLSQYRGEASFRSWLLRIATNSALKLLRARKAQREVALLEEDTEVPLVRPEFIAQWREDPSQLASAAETKELVRQALKELPEKYRLVFALRDIEGLTVHETAEALSLSEENVKVRLLRARLMLRERLTRYFGDEATQVQPGHPHE